jgi:hypothetical protein
VAGVEQRRPVLRRKIERILRKIVLVGERFGRGARKIIDESSSIDFDSQ